MRQEEAKERLVQSAFIGFQLGAAGRKTFEEYLCSLGLSGEPIQEAGTGKVDEDRKLARMGIKAKGIKKL